MAKVNFYPQGKSVTVEEGATILQAARKAGIVIESPCNGVGTCGKCKVRLDKESLNNVVAGGKHHLAKAEEEQGYVLSCEAKIYGNISVEATSNQRNSTLKILSKGQSFDISIKPLIKKEFFNTENYTKVFAGDKELGVEYGDTREKCYGAVVDIGTTTLVAAVVNLKDGSEIGTASALNPQAVHAQDVLSRIKFSSEADGLYIMYSEVVREINSLIKEIVDSKGISNKNIYEVVFSGNTCMAHLVTNTNPQSLGKYPYTPEINGAVYLNAREHKIGISPIGIIYVPPIISAYVGADITSGVLASQLHEKKGITLFVDIGTNGEMVIAFDGNLSATSTAAGPAFEGMNITHGMRAGQGAIEFFEIDEPGGISTKVIGNTKASGICGSGLLDVVGELVAHGVINKNGKFVEPEASDLQSALKERLVKQEGKWIFKITDKVFLSQKDVRQVQLAKGAVRAGIEFLLESKGVKAGDVDKVLIAGSFGYHLRAKSLINIGLLPKEFDGKIEFMGNTSKSGGQAFLLNKTYRDQLEKIVKQVEVLELANFKGFDKVFVRCLGF
ncbi:phenol hydroxylase P5 protein [Ruminiclostridium hungatei]|uniref:Phenol hydroxylase P5 protein n=1 Tax=Ruminiclostridium hungatei TaxID=48256 RepID=A0A1V4SL89_RUMHU|nr:ASKHA domain-containing protein [Ruminiclostridium hungatei]OPX43991.1 phenol hydroxylase P5 protein [Ruminiclostridium hungatei]